MGVGFRACSTNFPASFNSKGTKYPEKGRFFLGLTGHEKYLRSPRPTKKKKKKKKKKKVVFSQKKVLGWGKWAGAAPVTRDVP